MNNEELVLRYQQGNEAALANLILNNERLIFLIARRFDGSKIEFDDLTSVCKIYMIKAAQKFDCSMGLKFTTFAAKYMQGGILRELHYFSVQKNMATIVNLYDTIYAGDGTELTYADIIEDPSANFEESVIQKMAIKEVENYINGMKQKYRDIMISLLFHGKTQKQTAQELQISQQEVSRVYTYNMKILKTKAKRYLVA